MRAEDPWESSQQCSCRDDGHGQLLSEDLPKIVIYLNVGYPGRSGNGRIAAPSAGSKAASKKVERQTGNFFRGPLIVMVVFL